MIGTSHVRLFFILFVCKASVTFAGEPTYGSMDQLVKKAREANTKGDPVQVDHFLLSAWHFATMLPSVYSSTEEVDASLLKVNQSLAQLESLLNGIGNGLQISAPMLSPHIFMMTPFFFTFNGRNMLHELRSASRILRQMAPQLNYVSPWVLDKSQRQASHSSGLVRVGFSSEDFRTQHSRGIPEISVVIQNLPRDKFEVVLLFLEVSQNSRRTDAWKEPDALTHLLRQRADKSVHVPRDVSKARQVIEAEKLDVWVIIEIGMDFFPYELAYSRLAPVQVVTPGHYYSSGLSTIDYFITNAPQEHPSKEVCATWYSEHPVVMSDFFRYPDPVPDAKMGPDGMLLPPYAKDKLRENLFGSKKIRDGTAPNNLYFVPKAVWKLHPEMDAVFKWILKHDPESVIILQPIGADDWDQKTLRNRISKSVTKKLEHRIMYIPHLKKPDWQAMLFHADALVDTWPQGGFTAALEAVRLGRPWVTMPHKEMAAGRFTAALMKHLGCDELVAQSRKKLAEMAVKLATNRTFQSHMRRQVSEGSAAMFERNQSTAEWISFLEHVGRGLQAPDFTNADGGHTTCKSATTDANDSSCAAQF